jgi:hypothetical protein
MPLGFDLRAGSVKQWRRFTIDKQLNASRDSRFTVPAAIREKKGIGR